MGSHQNPFLFALLLCTLAFLFSLGNAFLPLSSPHGGVWSSHSFFLWALLFQPTTETHTLCVSFLVPRAWEGGSDWLAWSQVSCAGPISYGQGACGTEQGGLLNSTGRLHAGIMCVTPRMAQIV